MPSRNSMPPTPKSPAPREGPEQRLDRYRQIEKEREEWICDVVNESRSLKSKIKILKDLSNQNRQLEQNVEKLKSDVESQRRNGEALEKKAIVAEKQLREMKTEPANPFGLVLIDGDGYIFEEELLRGGSNGGAIAAQRLLEQIQGYFQKVNRSANQWKIMVRIFVDLEVREFAAAFTKAQPLFDIVDVGYGKEQADHKIRDTFGLFINNTHCKHILFGCCHDNGYVPMLNSWKNNKIVAPNVSLLQPYRFGKEYEGLPFEVARFRAVFRDTELPQNNTRSPVMNPAQPPRRMSAGSNGPKSQPQQTQVPSVAYDVKRPRSPAPVEAPTSSQVIKNRNGERLDAVLLKPNADDQRRFRDRLANKSQQPCNSLIVGGRCPTYYCKYDHEPLSLGELLCHVRRARGNPCAQGSACEDPNCVYGHMCPHDNDPYCRHGRECKFIMFHGKDKVPAQEAGDNDNVKRQNLNHDY